MAARDLIAKAHHYLRLSIQCSDATAAKALRIFAEYLIDKAREETKQGKEVGEEPAKVATARDSLQGPARVAKYGDVE